jgi:hypothetical protein
MFAESRSSGEIATTLHFIKRVTEAVTTNKTEPRTMLGRLKGSGGLQPRKIKAALMGRISKMCVYCSSWSASANEDVSGDHQTVREIAPRTEKTATGNGLKVESRYGALGTM